MQYYTYAYLREDRTPYYVGKGKGGRVYSTNRKGLKPPKDKSKIIFLKQNLTEQEAFKHEIYMIAVFGRKDLGTGILHNRTDGGDGVSGWKHTEETKIKIKEKRKNQIITEEHKENLRKPKHTEEWKINHIKRMTGRVVSDETRKKLSESQKGRIGKPITEETKRKISDKLKGKSKDQEHTQKIKNSKQGIRWWTNGIKNKMSKECPGEEWIVGKTSNPLPGRKGSIWWNNGIQNKCCKECPGDNWKRGKCKKNGN